MKANELRAEDLMVGDWVKYNVPNGNVFKIVDDYDIGDANFYKPIPITQEILEMNGFKGFQFFGELVYKGYLIQCDTRNIRIRCEEKSLIDIPCRYVHELQHALRLCRIEKEIEL